MPTDTAGSLHDRLAELGADALLETLASLQAGALKATPQQTEGVTYANKLSKEEAKIDWSQKAETIVHQIQAFNPWPVAHSLLHEQTVRLWQAEFKSVCHDKEPGTIVAISKEGVDIAAKAGTVHVKQVQFPGGKVLWVKDVLNAQNHPLQLGSKLQ
jgi:methionyl-tRNA formyltransferase